MRKKVLKRGLNYVEFDPKKVCKTCWYKYHDAQGYSCDFFNPVKFKVSENGTCDCWKLQDESVTNGE